MSNVDEHTDIKFRVVFSRKNQIRRYLEIISQFLLLLSVSISTIFWLPSIAPPSIRYMGVFVISGFTLVTGILILLRGQVRIPRSYVAVLPMILIPIYIATLGPETAILYFGFFLALAIYIDLYSSRELLNNILIVFTTSVTFQSVYALTTTYLPIPHFYTTYVRIVGGAPVSIYAFSGGMLPILLSISTFISVYLLYECDNKYKKLFLPYAFVTLIHLFVYASSTGTGRRGIALLLAFVLILFLYYTKLNVFIPVVAVSPVLLWILVYMIYAIFPSILSTEIFKFVNSFTSNRLILYVGGIDIILNDLSIVKTGGYNLSKIFPLDYPAKDMPRTPHNLLIDIFVDKGILVGSIISLWIWRITRTASAIKLSSKSQDIILASTIVIGHIFTGLLVGGGKIFSLNSSVIWWILLAYIFTSERNSEQSHKTRG